MNSSCPRLFLFKMTTSTTSAITKQSQRRHRCLLPLTTFAAPQVAILVSCLILCSLPISNGFSAASSPSLAFSATRSSNVASGEARTLARAGLPKQGHGISGSPITPHFFSPSNKCNYVPHRKKISTSLGSTASSSVAPARRERFKNELKTFLRVLLPAVIAGLVAFLTLPALCYRVSDFVTLTTIPEKMPMLSEAVSSFLSLVGLLYSILLGQVFGFLYSQQEALYLALFDEVTEAKSLLEQVALVSQGRTMYSTCLASIARYVREDLLGGTKLAPSLSSKKNQKNQCSSVTPSVLLSARPADDPLEAILYLTSVGVPGHVYDTVRSLRQARARRLGAMQRKVPVIHLIMLWILGGIMVMSFPVLVGVGCATAGVKRKGYEIMTLQGGLLGVATFAVVMAKCVLGELWRTKGGAYNVDSVLKVMVRGLEKELDERMMEAKQIMKRSKEA